MSFLKTHEAILPDLGQTRKRIAKNKIIGKVNINSSRKPFYIQVILWREQMDMLEHLGAPDEIGIQAVTLFDSYAENPVTGEVSPSTCKIAELHFVVDMWNMNVVTHEVFHAIVHRMRLMYPGASLLPYEEYADAEEEIAYELGNWSEKVFTWLFNNDPNNTEENFLQKIISVDSTKYLSTPKLPDWIFKQDESETNPGKQLVFDFNKEQP